MNFESVPPTESTCWMTFTSMNAMVIEKWTFKCLTRRMLFQMSREVSFNFERSITRWTIKSILNCPIFSCGDFLTSILFVLVVVVMTIGSSTFENTGCFFLVYFLLVVGDTGESPFDVTVELLDGISCGT